MAEGSGSRGGAPSRSSTRASEAGGAAFVHAGRRSLLGRTTDTSSADSFFAAEPPPPNVATAGLRVRQFVRPLLENEELKEAKLAFITAGGTDVPLEVLYLMRHSLQKSFILLLPDHIFPGLTVHRVEGQLTLPLLLLLLLPMLLLQLCFAYIVLCMSLLACVFCRCGGVSAADAEYAAGRYCCCWSCSCCRASHAVCICACV